nr:rhodanese-like domain-containing protein [Thioclava sp. F34-6]
MRHFCRPSPRHRATKRTSEAQRPIDQARIFVCRIKGRLFGRRARISCSFESLAWAFQKRNRSCGSGPKSGHHDREPQHSGIPSAAHLPFDALLNEATTFKSAAATQAILAEHVDGPDVSIISYCRLAHRATLASFAMTELLGYNNVRVYDGSWTEWGSMVGMPIER